MTEGLLPSRVWSEFGAEGPTILYTSAMNLLRSPSIVDSASNRTQISFDGIIRDGPHAFFLVCCVFLSTIGTILNTLTILTIGSLPSRIRQDATHTFILNLSIADLILSAVVIPTHWLQIVFRKIDFVGELLCDVSQLLFFWIFELSLFTLSVVSINRMVKICYNPSYSKIFSKNTIRVLIALLWLSSLLLVLPPFFGIYGSYEIFKQTTSSGKFYCGLANTSKSKISPSALYYTIGFFIPFVTIPLSYWRIYSKVREHRAHFKASNSDARSYKLFQTIAVIFVSFVICYLPNLIFRGWMSYTARFKYLRQLVKALMYGNTVLNPIVYFTMNSEYQTAYYRLVDKQKRRFNIGTAPAGTSRGPESRSTDHDPETAGTPMERSSDVGQEGGGQPARGTLSGATRMTVMRQADPTKNIVMSYTAIVGSLLIFVLIADFIRHRRLPDNVFEMQRRELAELD